MLKKTILFLALSCFIKVSIAQTPAYFDINIKYKTALELVEKGKYAAASSIFYEVERLKTTPNNLQESNTNVSQLKINSEYYRALCA